MECDDKLRRNQIRELNNFEANATMHKWIHWDTLHNMPCYVSVWSKCEWTMSSNDLFLFSVYSKWREFRKWMPSIITLFGSCCHFSLSAHVASITFFCSFIHIRSHNTQRGEKHNKNCANHVDLFSTAGALVINLAQCFAKQNEANGNNLWNAIYKN